MKQEFKKVAIGFLYHYGIYIIGYPIAFLLAWLFYTHYYNFSIDGRHITFINPEKDEILIIMIGGHLIMRRIKRPIMYTKRKILKHH